jgi:mannose-6-phosphate isomerase-like protein (cupin superfamily)
VHCDEHLLDVAPGDMILFPSHVPHQITNTGPDPLRLFTVWWNRETS